MEEKIEKFLSMEKPENWDFTNDCKCEKYIEIQNPIEKYIAYKSLTIDEKRETSYKNGQKLVIKNKAIYKNIPDPDTGSPILQEIYKVLWKDIANEGYMWHKGKIQADTMTSVTNSLNQYFEKIIETEEEKNSRGKNNTSKYYITELYARNPKEFIERLEKNENLKKFVSLYHTIGNFIVTPHLFNSARSGSGNSEHDYWDLTLTKIKEWYMEENSNKKNEILKILLHQKENDNEVISNCRNWLQYYGDGKEGLENFISGNYLEDFVKNNEPIMFCNHTWENSDIPKDEFDKFFETVSDLIEARGERLIKVLRNRI